jgi:hypothetical protein
MQSSSSNPHDQSNADASSMLAQLPSSNDAGSSEWSTVSLEPRSVSESDSLEHVVDDHLHQVSLPTTNGADSASPSL